MATVDSETPARTEWTWSDGVTEAGMVSSRAFSEPGTYTGTARVTNEGGERSASCLVTVLASVEMPTLVGCRAEPATVDAGTPVTIRATATGAETVAVDFGDGTSASAVPARHTYENAGRFSVTLQAENTAGRDRCAVNVTVRDPYCRAVEAPAPISFEFQDAGLSLESMGLLDEVSALFDRCSAVCLTIAGAAAEDEARDVAQQRADAVMFYFIGQGVDAERLRTSAGTASTEQDDRDPQRVDLVPSSCAGF